MDPTDENSLDPLDDTINLARESISFAVCWEDGFE
jgi:hypothetical protein